MFAYSGHIKNLIASNINDRYHRAADIQRNFARVLIRFDAFHNQTMELIC